MPFYSIPFLFAFLPATLAIYWLLLRRNQHRRWFLLLASYVFYGLFKFEHAVLLAGVTLAVYLATRQIAHSAAQSARRRWLIVALVAGLAPLAFFKYYDFTARTAASAAQILGMGPLLPRMDIVLPLGISFYTFQAVSYTIDIYRTRTSNVPKFDRFATFVALFPGITSGPILRYSNVADELEQLPREISPDSVRRGLFLIVVGLAKKVLVADIIASVLSPLAASEQSLQLAGAWALAVGLGLRLYFDFSGYSDMAIGIGQLLGFQYPVNFRAPYTARNPQDFWNRWHISLSSWIRDYLFLPLTRFSLERRGETPKIIVRVFVLLVTMALVGLWHGASWAFVIWGLWHGVLMSVYHLGRHFRLPVLPGWLARGLTFLAVCMGWPLFFSTGFVAALPTYAALVGLNGVETSVAGLLSLSWLEIMVVVTALILVNLPRDTWDLRPSAGWATVTALSALFLISVITLQTNNATPFLYFRF